MNIKIVKLLAAICAALVVVLIAEWITAKITLDRLLDSINPSPSQPYQIDEVPTIELKGKPEEFYSDLVSRPLFIKGRRPASESRTDQANAVSGPDMFDWQLIGVYTAHNTLSALFSRAKIPVPKDNFRKLKIDDDLDGWKLTEIHTDKVILMLGDESKELLLRKPKPKELPKTSDQAQTRAQNQAQSQAQLQRRNRPIPPSVPQPQTAVNAPENSDNE